MKISSLYKIYYLFLILMVLSGVSTTTARSANNAKVIFNTNETVSRDSKEGLILYYPFDDDIANDSSGNGNHGVVNGAEMKPGVSGKYYQFDGINDYIAVKKLHYNSVGVIPEITVCAWVNSAYSGGSFSDNWAIIDFDRSEYYNVFLRGDNGRVGFSTTDSNKKINDFSSKKRINDGKWHFIAAVYDGRDKIIYIDGEEDARKTDAHEGRNLGSGIRRYGFVGDGSEAGVVDGLRNGKYYSGSIDDLRIYHRALTVEEVASLYIAYNDNSAINTPPTFSTIGDQTVMENEFLSFSITAEDAENDPVELTVQGLPEGANFDGMTFSWTPTYNDYGVYSVRFMASDGELKTEETISIVVQDVEEPPIDNVIDVTVPWEANFTFPPQGEQGWSILNPSTESRLIYVSASEGDDALGLVYSPSSPQVGTDPQNPSGSIQSFKTITKAMTLAREGYPDWVLLKRGDEWIRDTVINAVSGRSISERSVLTFYGTRPARPLIKTGTTGGIQFWVNKPYVAVVGLNFYAHERDPNSHDFAGFDATESAARGFWIYSAGKENPNRSILIEDCVFKSFSNNVIQGTVATEDVIIRRSQILNNYSVSSHSQGLFTSNSSIFLEENLFDHNGWLIRQIGSGHEKAEGQATMFNHNTYFSHTRNTVFRGNIFSRASSMGNKFTANSPEGADEITVQNVLMDNNLYVEGELGISAGGNEDRNTGYRWQNMHIMNNVLLDIGRTRPTNRSLAWGIGATDWDGGRISGNYLLHYGNAEVGNIYGIAYGGHGQNVDISNNIFYQLFASKFALQIKGNESKEDLRIFDNEFQLQGSNMQIVNASYLSLGEFFDNNMYCTDRNSDSWFAILGIDFSFSSWLNEANDTGSMVEHLSYADPDRTVESYHASLGRIATLEAFIEQAKKQSSFNWRPEYTAGLVNSYVRKGFTLED